MRQQDRKRHLVHQAEQLEAALAAHKVPARIAGGTLTPRLVRFHLLPARGTKIQTIVRLAEELALSLGVPAARICRRKGQLEIEIPREDPEPVRLRSLVKYLARVPAGTAVLGRDEDGIPLLLRIPSPDVAHVLICGTTGSGKTALARSMITSLALTQSVRDVGLVLIDPKSRGYQPFQGLPHLARPIAVTPQEAGEVLAWLVEVMEQRDQGQSKIPLLLCFIDELADLTMAGGKNVQLLITRLAQRGRTAGIHLVACTQKPTVSVVGSLAKSNFPVRLVGRVTSPEDARVATGLKQTEAEKLLGRGDFLLVMKGEVVRFQAAYTSIEDIQKGVAILRGEHPLPLAMGDEEVGEECARC